MNNNIKIKATKKLSHQHYKLNEVTFEYTKSNGEVETQVREIYDKGSGAALFLYNSITKKIILTKQLRMPIYLNEPNDDGMAIEVCAGLLDGLSPKECIKKEALEETGYKIEHVKEVFAAYMTPGAVTEKVHHFIAEYNDSMKINEGGGLAAEQENIEVLELDFNDAYKMIATGEIRDAKTIILFQYARIEGLLSVVSD